MLFGQGGHSSSVHKDVVNTFPNAETSMAGNQALQQPLPSLFQVHSPASKSPMTPIVAPDSERSEAGKTRLTNLRAIFRHKSVLHDLLQGVRNVDFVGELPIPLQPFTMYILPATKFHDRMDGQTFNPVEDPLILCGVQARAQNRVALKDAGVRAGYRDCCEPLVCLNVNCKTVMSTGTRNTHFFDGAPTAGELKGFLAGAETKLKCCACGSLASVPDDKEASCEFKVGFFWESDSETRVTVTGAPHSHPLANVIAIDKRARHSRLLIEGEKLVCEDDLTTGEAMEKLHRGNIGLVGDLGGEHCYDRLFLSSKAFKLFFDIKILFGNCYDLARVFRINIVLLIQRVGEISC